jgi:hydroxyacylglutathione hydrolase
MTIARLPEVAPGVYHISLLGSALINAYVVGDILIDAGIRSSATQLNHVVAQYRVRAHALTHAHADHQGASHAICSTQRIPLWVHEKEVDLVERGAIHENLPQNVVTSLQRQFWAGPAHAVSRALVAGDDLNGFEVLETPGHAQGHISLWRASDRVLIAGDVLTNVNVITGKAGLHEPLGIFTLDAQRNRQYIVHLAQLEPLLTLFGHGQPLRDPEALLAFAAALPKPPTSASGPSS